MELSIRACEGGFYLAHLDNDAADPYLVCERFGIDYQDNMKFHSLGTIKEHFAALPTTQVWLVHNLAYDEMIGLPTSDIEHRQPLYWYS